MTATVFRRLGLLFAMMATGMSHATVFTSEAAFLSTNPGLSTIDFEGIAAAGSTALLPAQTGVTISSTAPIAVASASVCNSPSDFLFLGVAGDPLYIGFSPGVNAVGFRLASNLGDGPCGAAISDGTMSVYLYSGINLIASASVDASSVTGFDAFVGFSDLGNFDALGVLVQSDDYLVSIDNLSFGTRAIPEPQTLALLSVALLGAGFVTRRRTRVC